MSGQVRFAALLARIALSAARVTLGILWLHEGWFKYRAHFGRADILLVVDGAKANSRVPEYFTALSESILRGWAGLFGTVIPLLETLLGVALILGVLTLPAAIGSLLTLIMYWSSDQLIAQYPIMAALSAVVIAWPAAAAHFSVTSLAVQTLRRRQRAPQLVEGPLRRWL